MPNQQVQATLDSAPDLRRSLKKEDDKMRQQMHRIRCQLTDRGATLLICVLLTTSSGCSAEKRDRVVTVPVPDGLVSVSFSEDGKRHAFGVDQDGKRRIVVDGQPEREYFDITVVDFSPSGAHYFYGGKSEDNWHLIRDGKQIATLGQLPDWRRISGMPVAGTPVSGVLSQALPIWFAKESESYLVLCFPGDTGRFFKDGNWLPHEFLAYAPGSIAISSDGKHYAFGLYGERGGTLQMYSDGLPVGKYRDVGCANYLQPGNKLVYRALDDEGWRVIVAGKPLPGYETLTGSISVSPDARHIAALVRVFADGVAREMPAYPEGVSPVGVTEAVVVDGKRQDDYLRVEWSSDKGLFFDRGSFVWAATGPNHAYVVQVGTDPRRFAVVHNGTVVGQHDKVSKSSLTLSDDGNRVAYAAEASAAWHVYVDGKPLSQPHQEIGIIAFVPGRSDRLVYTARQQTGWALHGNWSSPTYTAVAGPFLSPSGDHCAFYAQVSTNAWQVYADGNPISDPLDGVLVWPQLRFGRDGAVKFVAIRDGKIVWIEGKPD